MGWRSIFASEGLQIESRSEPSPPNFKFFQAAPAVIFAIDGPGDRSVEGTAVKVAHGRHQLLDLPSRRSGNRSRAFSFHPAMSPDPKTLTPSARRALKRYWRSRDAN